LSIIVQNRTVLVYSKIQGPRAAYEFEGSQNTARKGMNSNRSGREKRGEKERKNFAPWGTDGRREFHCGMIDDCRAKGRCWVS